MSVLVVGLSYASAPVSTLERAVVSGEAQTKLLRDVFGSENVAGALVLSTCNRIEVYAEVDRFHGAVAAVCELLARHSGMPLSELTASAYVHYDERAVHHLLAVASGLESMVVGESQILGQVRRAVKAAREHGTLSRELSDVSRLALRAGRRAHAETGIDAAGQNLVSLGLALAARSVGRAHGAKQAHPVSLRGLNVLVVGAGSMSALAVATAVRQEAGRVVVANRTLARAGRLAAKYGASAARLSDLPACIAASDIVVTCTGAAGYIVTQEHVKEALAIRSGPGQPGPGRPGAGRSGAGRSSTGRGPDGRAPRRLALLDLALPRDVEAAAAELPGVSLLDLEALGGVRDGELPAANGVTGQAKQADVAAVRQILAQELATYVKARRAENVAPTVVALRAKAATVVESELARLEGRLGDMDPRTRREIAQTMGRIADKLLHGPTVRVKELAGSPGGDSYETALRVLFELDPGTVQAIQRPGDDVLAWSLREATQ